MGGETETMCNQLTFIFSKELHGQYYPCTWLSFVNQKNEEKKKKEKRWLMKTISTVPKVLFFKTTDLYTVYLFSEYADK